MQTKIKAVMKVVMRVSANRVTACEAYDVAQHLLRRTEWSTARAKALAAAPYVCGRNISW